MLGTWTLWDRNLNPVLLEVDVVAEVPDRASSVFRVL